MSLSKDDVDLLRPSLTADDDVGQVSEPWNPSRITLLAFFFGFVTAGILFGLNYKRLGEPRKMWPTILGFSLLCVVFYAGLFWGMSMGWWDREDRTAIKIFVRAAALVPAIFVAGNQQKRFRMVEFTGDQVGSLWIPGTLAVLAGIAIQVALGMVGAVLFVPLD